MKDLTEIAEPPELTDGRLSLRALRPEDKPAVVAALNDPQCGRFLWQPPYPYADDDFDAFQGTRAKSWVEDRHAYWSVTDAETGEVLAGISLGIEERCESGEIGYWTGPWARGRGVMAAAVRLVRDWAFDGLGLQRVEITTFAGNVASQRVALAAGFTREGARRSVVTARGERRDDVIFGMIPGDPRPAAGERRPGLGWPRLTDGRLLLRPFEHEDAPAVQAACDDPDIAHWIYAVPAPYTLADAEEFIAGARVSLVRGERARLAVVDATGGGVDAVGRGAPDAGASAGDAAVDTSAGELLGSVSLDVFADREAAEIGYWVKRDARRRGVALSAARLVVDWAFGELGIERLEILTYPGNEVSQALAGKLGFTREGLLRGFLAAEPGKRREGRVVPAPDGSLPARDDQVQFARLRTDPAPADSHRDGVSRRGA